MSNSKITNTPIIFHYSNNKSLNNEIYNQVEKIIETYLEDLDYGLKVLDLIKNNLYSDWIEINSSTITKQEIVDIISIAKRPAIDQVLKLKFFYFKDFDSANQIIQNTLLKFIEEPNNLTFIFFSAQNMNAILPTIKSRAITIKVVEKKPKIIDLQIDSNFINYDQKIIGIANELRCLCSITQVKSLQDKFNSLTYLEINYLLRLLLDSSDQEFSDALLSLIQELKYNPNKTLIFFKLLKLKGL